jgi:hypothetical protein
MAPLESNGHQVTEKEMPPTIRRLVENFALCRIGPKPIPPCSPSRLVALSRCPDATYILTARAPRENGTKVTRSNHRRRASLSKGDLQRPFTAVVSSVSTLGIIFEAHCVSNSYTTSVGTESFPAKAVLALQHDEKSSQESYECRT